MKKLIALALLMFVAVAMGVPAYADAGAAAKTVVTTSAATAVDNGQEQVKNVQTGSRNTSTGWVEVLDATHMEAAKGKSSGEQITGVVAGGAIGVRKAIHRTGAGIIDLITFWIPKKQPLVNPEKARLE